MDKTIPIIIVNENAIGCQWIETDPPIMLIRPELETCAIEAVKDVFNGLIDYKFAVSRMFVYYGMREK